MRQGFPSIFAVREGDFFGLPEGKPGTVGKQVFFGRVTPAIAAEQSPAADCPIVSLVPCPVTGPSDLSAR